jgi:hypothetical protein
MNWMNGRKGSCTCFADITFVIMVLFLVLSYAVPTPTVASGLTDTPTPISTPAATDTLTQSYPSPILVSPKLGETIKGKTSFSWQWDGALQEGEWFDLQIWQRGKPSLIVLRRNCTCLLDTPSDGFGLYLWQVAVVRIDESGNKSTLCESLEWSFVWSDVPPTALTIYLRDTPTETGFAALSGDQPNGGMIYEEGKCVYGEAAVRIGETTYHFNKPEVGPGEPKQLPAPWWVELEFAEALAARTVNKPECAENGPGFDPKKAQFWMGRLDENSAVEEENPYSLTMKLYEGNELRESIQVFFAVADAPHGDDDEDDRPPHH